MAVVTKAANAQTAVLNGGWTNAANAFALAPDGSFATAVTSRNATTSGDYGFPDFTSADIPDGSTVNSITVHLNWGLSAAVTGGVDGAQIFVNGVAQGTEATSTGTAPSNAQVQITGVSLADVRSASTLIKARVRTTKGNTNTAMSGQLDFISLDVNYSPPLPQVNVRQANTRAKQSRRTARRLGAVAALGLFSPWVSGSVNKPIPFGVSASAVTGSPTATLSTPIPIGRTITASGAGGGASGTQGGLILIRHRTPLPRRGGGVASLGIETLPAVVASAATLAKPIPIGRTIAASAVDTVLPGVGSMIVPRIPRAHVRVRHQRIYLKTPPPPVSGRTATLVAPIRIGRSISASAVAGIALNKPIPIGRVASAIVGSTATVAKAIPMGRTIRATVPLTATVARAIPIGRTITVTNRADATLAKPIPMGRTVSATVLSAGSITLARAIPIGRAIAAQNRVDATLAKPIPIGRAIIATNPTIATVAAAIPIGRSIAATAFNAGQFILAKPIPIGRSIRAAVRVDGTLATPIPIGRFINIITPPPVSPPVGEPTSAIPTDDGLRSAIPNDAGVRSVVLTDAGRRSAIVNHT